MTWGVIEPNGFGVHWPDGDYVGYDEGIEQYYKNSMPASEKAKLGMEARLLRSPFSDKFHKDLGWLADHEKPKVFKTWKSYKELFSLISLNSKLIAVDETLKGIIEELEPGVHQFWPIEITMPKDTSYPVPYYGMVIHNHLNSFRLEDCDPGLAVDDSIGDYIDYVVKARSRSDFKGLAMSREEIGNRHIWREKYLRDLWIFFSDELAARIKASGLKMPKHYPMKDV
ncbi:imm11 family protein [Thalassobius sp. Cn5-15]|uniref:imm11 family protein n=1 Tax=Thalassobius sp. Cn5-15 TaxID=2917763 RepID=UPI001EF3A21F|nr:DUF1629 domain-containing protein [Thalassobius sp. Cn5-15]MCG7495093.1 hypothetical protein [Thalassobius sp. Cn5-15]